MDTDTQGANQPDWFTLFHYHRYRRLNKIRRVWGRRYSGKREDRRGRAVHLDGTWINDVPSFYLSLGEAINGRYGYFGGNLDSLDDCLCGHFGVLPPLTFQLSRFEEVRRALDARAWSLFHAEVFQEACLQGDSRDSAVFTGDLRGFIMSADYLRESLIKNGYLGNGSDADVALWSGRYHAALAGESFDCDGFGSYFDAILEVLESRGASLVPAT